MKKTYVLVYTSDAWHTNASKTVIGLFSSIDTSISNIKTYIKTEDLEPLNSDDERNLFVLNQTQGRDVNFIIESITLNQLLE